MEYYYFITKHPKFENLPVAYCVFICMIPKVKQWFSTSECQALYDSKFNYWKDSDNEREEEDGMEISPNIQMEISKNSSN
ncbi:hypothetical protein BC830DRAFT_1092149 [Chytriomyces sp. MP71]|nr:hypothetical protein BC830DRAFT_1092149 [Chytriomyces sp. MP71]